MSYISKQKNKSNKNPDWSWKGQNQQAVRRTNKEVGLTKSQKKAQKKRDRKQKIRQRAATANKDEFFGSNEWLRLRYRVLKKYGGACMLCGRTYKVSKVCIHVDHIKPRSKFPELALVFENLQVLCEDCNIGKSNLDCTDWRPDAHDKDLLTGEEVIELELASMASKIL